VIHGIPPSWFDERVFETRILHAAQLDMSNIKHKSAPDSAAKKQTAMGHGSATGRGLAGLEAGARI
jgi:hypothetical protein